RLEAKMAQLERLTAEPQKRRMGQASAAKDENLRRARLIFNPKSGEESGKNSKELVDMVSRLRAHGILAGIGLKTSGKAARDLAKEAVENNEELVIVAGGDGTVEDVASQLIGSKTTLGILPTGTMNNLARCLGVPLDIEDACALLGVGVTRQIDVGRVVSNAKPEVEYFLEAAGVGLSAIVIPTGQALEKGRWGVLPLALRKLFDTKPEPIQIELDDEPAIHASSQIVTVSNAPMLGKNILIAPDAKMDDGYLDIAIYNEMTKTDLLQYFMAASNGQHAENPKIKFHRARRVRISANRELDANSDKELIPGKQVLEIEVVPQALSVVAGKGIGLSLPVEAVPATPPLSGPQPEGSSNGNGTEKQVETIQ
ncbi:MAG: diacylglycerol/lipid kinase family protein, partial [Acidobacteriota bacterium]